MSRRKSGRAELAVHEAALVPAPPQIGVEDIPAGPSSGAASRFCLPPKD
jgi:hypothetical protein